MTFISAYTVLQWREFQPWRVGVDEPVCEMLAVAGRSAEGNGDAFGPSHAPASQPRFPRLLAMLVVACLLGSTHAAELRVDLNRNGQDSSTTETNYVAWSIPDPAGSTPSTRAFPTADGTITVTVAMPATSPAGTGLVTNWYKQYAQTNPDVNGSRLVSDGVTVANGNAGGQIQMTITGLLAGHHSLLTYHNAWDSPDAIVTQGPIDIFLNGTQVIDNLQQTIRAISFDTASTAYLEFDVTGPADVVTVLFAADPTSTASVRNPVINGFEIDTPNSIRQAHTPGPADNDEHVDADNGRLTLSWTAATTAISHNVYFGTSLSAVTAATTAAPEFKGNQTATTFAVSNLSSALTYYWRIDEVATQGVVTRGAVWHFRTRHLAFPGAEGYGRFARGGRGGRVVEVTSLADYAPGQTPISGTLRYAIEQETGPRTIVFAVSGMITLVSRLTVNSPYLTIAGQTAPGKGICLRQYTMGLSGAQDVIVRNVRSRPGNISGTTIDGMGMSGSNHCILDHCSVSWSIDEAFSSRSAQNITLQRTLISEALNVAGHQNYPAGTMHGYAASIGGDTGSFHHNLLAHCYGRNWSLAGGLDGSGFFSGRLDLTDNVVYNWGHRTTDGGAMEVNFVNNYYKPGAATDYFFALNAQYDNFPGTQRYYFAGNVMPGRFDETTQALGRTATASNGGSLPTYQNFVDAPFFASFITTQPARVAYKYVLSDVGCNQPALDDHDTRVIREARDGTFTYRGSVSGLAGMPDTQADVGGWEAYSELYRAADWDSDHDGLPDWWERIAGTNPNSPAADFSDANADLDGDGYTNLEDYLNWTAAPHYDCSAGGSIDIDLSRLSAGFSAGPQFVVSGAVGGTVSLLAGGTTARFTSTESASRLGRFQFTVTDTEGTSLTREVGIRVISAAVQGSSTLTALSLRSVSQSRSSPLIVGFSVSGTQRVLLRGVGPTLGAFGVASVLPDPVMEIYHRAGSAETMIASNDDWASGDVTALQAAFQAANTFALDRTSKDAALLTTITGVNSAFVYDTAGRSGVVMVELYDAGIDGASRLVGISARNLVGTGENVLIAGFVISGNASKRLLIRGVGPTLGSFGVPGALADPRLDVYDGANHLLTGNDDWGSGDVVAMRAAFTAASEFDLPSSSKDAALLVYLAPGLYSAVVSGVGGLTGEALIEIYEVP